MQDVYLKTLELGGEADGKRRGKHLSGETNCSQSRPSLQRLCALSSAKVMGVVTVCKQEVG